MLRRHGGSGWHVVVRPLLPEALPTLLAGLALTVVMLIGFSSHGRGGRWRRARIWRSATATSALTKVMAGTVVMLLLLVTNWYKRGWGQAGAGTGPIAARGLAASHHQAGREVPANKKASLGSLFTITSGST